MDRTVQLGVRRPAEDGGGARAKKARNGAEVSMKKVAEMVLVLAGMGKMRGGKAPSDVEREIMARAREELAKVCEMFPPKDVFPRDVFGGIIEDLGLNKVREQRLGVRPPKITVAEKFLLSKRKMERIDELAPPSLRSNSGAVAENRASVPPGRVFSTAHSPGSFQPSPLGHMAGGAIPYQLPTSELRPSGASGLSTSHPGVPPRMDRPQFRLDGRPNGSSQPLQVQGYPSADSSVKAPAWSAQSQSAGHTTGKLEGITDTHSGISGQFTLSKPVITPASSASQPGMHQHFQGAPRNTHAEISKMVQKFLQPQASERPLWTPPSKDYMNKPTLCQTCKTLSSDVDDVYVCDNCEKAYHLKCLQINPAKGIQRGDWHCDKCLQLSNGKPLPPKFGRVLRNINASKGPSTTSALQSTSDQKTGPLGEKVSHQKVMPNGGSTILTGPAGSTGGHPTSESKVEISGDIGQNAFVGKEMDSKSSLTTSLNNSVQATITASVSSTATSSEEKFSELKLPPKNIMSLKRSLAKNHQEYPDGKKLRSNLSEKSKQDDSGTVPIPSEISPIASGPREQERPLPDCLNSVDWIGGVLKIEDQKAYYQSCCINGLVYRVKDHVLVRFNNRLIPSKLQAMWEDTHKKTKWVTVNRCYFPSDLPETVGRPCGLESSEVYESIISCIVMAGFIQGPCEVLSPSKFLKECERRANAGKKPIETLRPLFLCKWIYDESKGLFRDVNC